MRHFKLSLFCNTSTQFLIAPASQRVQTSGSVDSLHFLYGKSTGKGKFTLEKAKGGAETQLYSFLKLGARWGWVVNATPRPLYPRERPGTHCIGGWVGPKASLDMCGKSRLHRDSIPGPSSPYRVAIPTEPSRHDSFLICTTLSAKVCSVSVNDCCC